MRSQRVTKYSATVLEILTIRNTKLTADDDVLETTGNRAVPELVERGLVTSLQPRHALRISDESLGRLLWVIPIALGELVPSNTELTPLANWHNVALGVDNLGPGVRQDLAYGRQSCVDTVGREGIEAGGGGLGETYIWLARAS